MERIMTPQEFEAMRKNDQMTIVFTASGFLESITDKVLSVFELNPNDILGKHADVFNERLGIRNRSWFSDIQHDFHAQCMAEITSDNQKRWMLWNFEAVLQGDAAIECIVGTGHEITDFMKSNANFVQDQNHDSLTGLLNRQGLDDQIHLLKGEVTKAASFLIECRSFSKINDYYGHQIGDELMMIQAKELEKYRQDFLLISRYSEDQFILFCVNEMAEPEKVQAIISVLEQNLIGVYKVRDLTIQSDRRIGYALYPEDTDDLQKLVTCSSLAMNESVKLDQISVKHYQKHMSETLEQNVLFANKLREAIDNHKIEVHFQKIINVGNDKVVSFEELARWTDEELGTISPKTMFAIAKESNLIDKLERYLAEQAILSFKQLSERYLYKNTMLSLNLTPTSLLDPHFLDYLDIIVLENDLKNSDVCIEISESTFVNSLDLCIKRINEYKKHGYGIAIDDFGREYSSLAILETVAFDIIKIDALFVDKIAQRKNQEIIKMIYKIAKIANQIIIAEGVETKNQRDILKQLGCTIQQGYFFNRPQNLASILNP